MGNFELQWADFGDNLSASFKDLREEGDLFDVTLACDDDQLEAHRVVLSASSTFFKSVIKRNPHAHPLLYLKGVKIEDLKSLLDFMYLGKTKIAQDHVETFLKLGEELGVKGLVRNEQMKNTNERPDFAEYDPLVEKTRGEPSKKQKQIKETKETQNFLEYDALIEKARRWQRRNKTKKQRNKEIFDVKIEEIQNCNDIDIENGESLLQDEEVFEVLNDSPTNQAAGVSIDLDVNAQIENLLSKATNSEGEIGWQCTECKKYSKDKNNLKKHIEIHLGFSFGCKYCTRVYKTRNTLNYHMNTSKLCRSIKTSGL